MGAASLKEAAEETAAAAIAAASQSDPYILEERNLDRQIRLLKKQLRVKDMERKLEKLDEEE